MKKPLLLFALSALWWASVAAAQSASYLIDPMHTFVNFELDHLGLSTTRGRFDRSKGSVQFNRSGRSGRAELIIDIASVNTGDPAIDQQLLGKDFFDSAAFPTATYVAERFVFDADRVTFVEGQLTVRGRTVPVTLKAIHFNCYRNPLFRREVCGGDFEATLLRSQWGLTTGAEWGLADSVRLLIQVEAVRQ